MKRIWEHSGGCILNLCQNNCLYVFCIALLNSGEGTRTIMALLFNNLSDNRSLALTSENHWPEIFHVFAKSAADWLYVWKGWFFVWQNSLIVSFQVWTTSLRITLSYTIFQVISHSLHMGPWITDISCKPVRKNLKAIVPHFCVAISQYWLSFLVKETLKLIVSPWRKM